MELLLPGAVREACALLAANHMQAYVVGGGVRDLLLGVAPLDWDLATDAPPSDIAAIFTGNGCRVAYTGARYGTVTVHMGDLPLEITTFRVEGGYHDLRRPTDVTFVPEIERDLARRDFTINAIAYDPLRALVVDPFWGMQDLLKMRVKAVGDPDARIGEDALRMMRAVRIASDYGFRIETATMCAIVRHAELVRSISSERVRNELSRTLMAANYLEGLHHLLETGLLFLIIPELYESWLFPQFHPFHQHTVLTHTLEALRYTPSDLDVRLAVLLHDVAKPRSFSRGPDGRGHFYGHDLLGAEMAETILLRLRYSAKTINKVTVLVREHMLNLQMRPPAMRRLIARVGRAAVPGLLSVKEADFLAHSTGLIMHSLPEWELFRGRLKDLLAEDGVFRMGDLAVNGDDLLEALGCEPGPLIGIILDALWNEVLECPRKNRRSYLLDRAVKIAAKFADAPGGWV